MFSRIYWYCSRSVGRVHQCKLFIWPWVLITDRLNRRESPITFKLHLRSLSLHSPHPLPSIPILEYESESQWSSYSFVMQIMGHSLGVLFTSGVLGDSDYERFVVWDWVTGVRRGVSDQYVRWWTNSLTVPRWSQCPTLVMIPSRSYPLTRLSSHAAAHKQLTFSNFALLRRPPILIEGRPFIIYAP